MTVFAVFYSRSDRSRGLSVLFSTKGLAQDYIARHDYPTLTVEEWGIVDTAEKMSALLEDLDQ